MSEPFETEEERARKEDPEFAIVLAQKRAMARGEVYNPAIHGPFDMPTAPRQQRVTKAMESVRVDADAILERFRSKGGRHLRAIPNAERESVRKVRDL